jgi:tripartite ATP-independent transporter DctM subunit
MVVNGWLGDVSIGGLFIGGLIPGAVLGGSLMIMTVVLSFRMKMPRQSRPPVKDVLRLSKRALLSLLTPIIIVGGIWSGVFTPTESGAVASLYALVLGMIVYRDVSFSDMLEIFRNTIEFTAIVLFIISVAVLYGWLLVRLQIPMILAEGVIQLTGNTTLLLIILSLFFLLVGCFMSVVESILIFTPIVVPMVKQLGIDPLFFGIIMVISLSVGVITPPFGNVLYVLVGITGRSFEDVVRAHIPFLIPIFGSIVIMILFPAMVTFLPRMMQ